MIKRLLQLTTLLCTLAFANAAFAAKVEIGKSYYTTHNFMFEKGRHVTTNYWRGEFVPVNTKVTVESMGKKKMVLSFKGTEVVILNKKAHTKRSMQEVADRMLSSKKVAVGGKFAKDMKFGELRLGMTKQQVLKTRGYPPAHKTFSTESDRWIYWSSKFVQRTLVFENNKLVAGRGIR